MSGVIGHCAALRAVASGVHLRYRRGSQRRLVDRRVDLADGTAELRLDERSP